VNIQHSGMDNTRITASVFNTAMLKLSETEYAVSGNDFLTSIDLSTLPTGLYFLQLKYDNKIILEKIIKQ